MQQWYALHTKVHAEQKAARELHRHGIETYVPEISSKTGKSAKSTLKRVAFFPGYLFMNVDLSSTNAVHWRWATGVRHIVSYGDRPVAIPEEIIGLIRRQLAQQETEVLNRTHKFKKGDYVRIAEGPFSDMLAIFEGPNTATERVTVLMEFLGRLSRVRVEIDSLEPAKPRDHRPGVQRRRRTRGKGRPIRYAD